MEILRHPRTRGIKALIENGEITRFDEIFGIPGDFPRSILASYVHTNNNRIARLIRQPGELTGDEIKEIADYFEVSVLVLQRLVNRQLYPYLQLPDSPTTTKKPR